VAGAGLDGRSGSPVSAADPVVEGAEKANPTIEDEALLIAERHGACRQAGMNDCLLKPISLETLQRAFALAAPASPALDFLARQASREPGRAGG
jgi:hypothetical protein